MSTDRVQVRVDSLDESDPLQLYQRYDGEFEPQSCHVSLDLEDGTLTANWNGETGNGVPMEVWHGRVRRYTIPPLKADAANVLLEELAPFAQSVLGHSSVEWDGRNHVGRVGEGGADAEDALREICAGMWADSGRISVSAAEDLYDDADPAKLAAQLGITAETMGEEIYAIGQRETGVAQSNDIDVVEGLEDYLERVRDWMRHHVED